MASGSTSSKVKSRTAHIIKPTAMDASKHTSPTPQSLMLTTMRKTYSYHYKVQTGLKAVREKGNLKLTKLISLLACLAAGHVCGDKNAMTPHLHNCHNASKSAKDLAKSLSKSKKTANADDRTDADTKGDSNSNGQPQKKQKQVFEAVKTYSQSQIKVFRGLNIPFNNDETAVVQQQFLQATISTNLPFMWTKDVEVIKLFIMFRARATDVMPTASSLAGRLLNAASEQVETEMQAALAGKYATLA